MTQQKSADGTPRRVAAVLPTTDLDHGYPWVLVVHTAHGCTLYPAHYRWQAAGYLATNQFEAGPDERMVFEIVPADQVDTLPALALGTR